MPHTLVTNFSVGDKFKVGDVITYNSGFFTPDPLDPKQVLMKGGVLAKTAILEKAHTFEDASVVSETFAARMGTQTTKVRTITVRFDQTIRNLVQVGSEVDIETVLCTIEDSVTASNDLFDGDSLDTLKLMSTNTPSAKAVGKIDKIEVFYHGDIEDMSDSLQDIAKQSDKIRMRKLRGLGKTPTTGSIDGTVRIDKDPLDVDTMAIRIYITGDISCSVGDKVVFANQMKSIISDVMTGTNKTESGEDIDALFSYVSINNRIVLSPELIGTTTTLLKLMSKRVAESYFLKVE